MSELIKAQREGLLATADKHEEAANTVNKVIEFLESHGYTVFGKELADVVGRMIAHVDTVRELARKDFYK